MRPMATQPVELKIRRLLWTTILSRTSPAISQISLSIPPPSYANVPLVIPVVFLWARGPHSLPPLSLHCTNSTAYYINLTSCPSWVLLFDIFRKNPKFLYNVTTRPLSIFLCILCSHHLCSSIHVSGRKY